MEEKRTLASTGKGSCPPSAASAGLNGFRVQFEGLVVVFGRCVDVRRTGLLHLGLELAQGRQWRGRGRNRLFPGELQPPLDGVGPRVLASAVLEDTIRRCSETKMPDPRR